MGIRDPGSYELGFRPRPRPSTEPTQPLTHHANPQAKHAGLPARPQAPRPAASTAAARLRRLAAPDAHPTPPAVHRPDAMAPPVRPPRRRPRALRERRRPVHALRQRTARQHVHQPAARDEPAQLRGVRRGHHRGRV